MNLSEIARRKCELEARVLDPNYQTGERDLAEAQELVNQYIDELERLENTATVARVTDPEKVSERIMRIWHG